MIRVRYSTTRKILNLVKNQKENQSAELQNCLKISIKSFIFKKTREKNLGF